MALTIDAILQRLSVATHADAADYAVLGGEALSRVAHLAVSKAGAPALLVPVTHVPAHAARLTHGILMQGVPTLEFSHRDRCWREPAAVIENRDPRLLRTFAGLVIALISRLETEEHPSWELVASLFSEWERLLGRRQVLSREAELGLWGELWLLAHTSRPADLLDGWRGPDSDVVDFLLDGIGFEVKTARRQGVHTVSQKQVDAPLAELPVVFVSVFAKPDPLKGRSLSELVGDVGRRIGDVGGFEEKLAEVGYSRDDEVAYARPYALLDAPAFYYSAAIPRVRSADPGVSDLRYRVELPRDLAILPPKLDDFTKILGLDWTRYEFPCA